MSHLQYLRPFDDTSFMEESPQNDSTSTANNIKTTRSGASPFGSPDTSRGRKRVSFLTNTNKTSKAATMEKPSAVESSTLSTSSSTNPADCSESSTFMMDLDDDLMEGGLSTTQPLYGEQSNQQPLSGIVPSNSKHQMYKLFERAW